MTDLTPAQQQYVDNVVKPYVESIYHAFEAELDYWNSDEVQDLRVQPQRYASVGELLRRKKVAAVGSQESLLTNEAITKLSKDIDVPHTSDMYLAAVQEVFAANTPIEGLTFFFAPNVGILVKKA